MTILLAVAGVLAVALPVRVAVAQGTKPTTSAMTVTSYPPYTMNCTVAGPWVSPGEGPTGTVTFTDATAQQTIGTATLPSAPQVARFGAPIYTPGHGQVIATGDFNRDGNLDVVLADAATSSLVVLLGKGNGKFEAPVSYPLPAAGGVGAAYGGIVAGDFTGNGKLSVAVTNEGSAAKPGTSISVALGNGDGTFQAATTYPVGESPEGIVSGYFNADDNLDLAVTNSYYGSVSILLGKGDGTFGTQTKFAALNAGPIVTGDFNQDGIADLVVGNTEQDQIEFLAGNGDGTFQNEVDSYVSTEPVYMAAGDFNQDGIPDLVILSVYTPPRLVVLLNSGAGSFAASWDAVNIAPEALGMGTGELTEAGVPAVIVTVPNSTYSAYYGDIWFSDGKGGLTNEVSEPLNYPPGAIVAGDFNGDGVQDLVFAPFNFDYVTTLLNTEGSASGSLTNVLLDAGVAPTHYLHCTYNGDTNYAAGSAGYTHVSLLETIPPSFAPLIPGTYFLPTSVALADSMASANIYYTKNGSKPNSSSNLYTGPIALSGKETIEAIAYAPGYLPSGVVTATYTQQAATPVMAPAAGTWAAGTTITITDLPTKGTIHYTTNGTTPTGNSPIYKVPFTLISSETVEAVAFSPGMLMSGVASTAYTIASAATPTPVVTPPAGGYTSVPSVKISDSNSGAKIYYTTNGSTPTASSPVYSGMFTLPANAYPIVTVKAIAIASGEPPSAVASASFTITNTASTLTVGGSDPYTLNCTVAGPAVSGLSGPAGTVTFTDETSAQTLGSAALHAAVPGLKFTSPFSSSNPGIIAVADFNGDGIPDVVLGTGSLQVMDGNGDGTFQPPVTTEISYAVTSLITGDFNGDGKLDVAFVGNKEVYVALGNGNGSFQAPMDLYSGTSSPSVAIAAADFAENGYSDLAVTNESAGTVTILWGESANPFTRESVFPAGLKPNQVVAVDFNRDQRPDLAITISTGIEVMLNNGDGTFAAPLSMKLGGTPSALLAREFNKDGFMDLAVQEGLDIWILLGNGDGTFETPAGPAVQLQGILLAADFNGDGSPDLAGASPSLGTSIALGNGDGTFHAPIRYALYGEYPATADFNRDGRFDLAFGSDVGNFAIELSTTGETAVATLDNAVVTAGSTARHNLDCSYAGNAHYAASVSSPFGVGFGVAATPLFAPGTNSYTTPQSVKISDASANVTIYYTTDDSTPTTSSTQYTGAITVSKTTTVKAIAAGVAYLPSAVSEAVYTITP